MKTAVEVLREIDGYSTRLGALDIISKAQVDSVRDFIMWHNKKYIENVIPVSEFSEYMYGEGGVL